MLSQQQTIQLTAYADLYDKVVPQKHLLRQINDLIDFSFVYQELVSKYCPDNGRRAESPIQCKTCAFRDGCYKKGAKSKSYSISIKSETQTEQMACQETPEFRELYRTERYKIEAKNAELKNVLGYDRAESYGMDAMQMQGAITMFAANVKRIIKLLEETK